MITSVWSVRLSWILTIPPLCIGFVTDLYTLLMIDQVSSALDIHPKHADGSEVDMTDPADYFVITH